MTKFIAVASGKGGVGKTTTAINLGMALTNFGKSVIVVDANLTTPNVGLHLGVPKVPVSFNEILKGRKSIRDAVYLHNSGLKIVPSSISIDDLKGMELGNEKLNDVLVDFYGLVDVVILDTAAGLGSEAVSAIKASDELVLVTTPDMPSVADALKTIKVAEENGVKVSGVIVNKSSSDDHMSAKNIESLLEKPVLGIVPEDSNVRLSLKMNYPVVFSHPDTSASISYKQIAAKMFGQKYEEKTRKNGFRSVLKKLGF